MSDTTVTHEEGHDEHGFAHVMAPSTLITVFVLLLALTWLTVFVSANVELGEFEIWASMGIATVKAALVIFLFMHMAFDKPLNGILFFFSFLFVALFVGVALTDKYEYNDDVKEWTYEQMREENAKGPDLKPEKKTETTPKEDTPKAE